MDSSHKVHPVILSGGSGTRLWPLSRALYPKQLLPLAGQYSMLQETVLRVGSDDLFHVPTLIANAEHRFIIAEQLREIGAVARAIVLEPVGRNTAPAAAAAALMLAADDAEAILAVFPSDHLVRDRVTFEAAVELAAEAARTGSLVAFGVPPTAPETGYGYIRRGGPVEGAVGCFRIDSFVEKPDAARAQEFLDAGGYAWNSGMFVFSAAAYLEELERLQPDMLASCRKAVASASDDLDFLRLGEDAFAGCPAGSIDYAVMEHTERAAVVPVDFGWNDIGAWPALWEIGDKDADGNVVLGDAALEDVRNSYLRSADGRLIAAIGIEDLVVVTTEDAVLIVPMDRSAEVKPLVERLGKDGRQEAEIHRRVYRPWGYYQEIDHGERFHAKRIMVKPGAQLSLQKHGKRAEHWVVVRGMARVTRGDETFDLQPDQSAYIPIGEVHRLENPGNEPLHIIEIQTGDYLGEDDIERLEDDYGRK